MNKKTAQNGKGDKPRKGAEPQKFREGWERVFGKKRQQQSAPPQSDALPS